MESTSAAVVLNWADILNTAIGGVIAAAVAFGVERWRRNSERGELKTDRVAAGQAALLLFGLHLRTVAEILRAINPLRENPERWLRLFDIGVPLVVQGDVDMRSMVWLATGTNATPHNATLVFNLGRSQALVHGAVETALERRRAYAQFHDEVAHHLAGLAPSEVPASYLESDLPLRVRNAIAKLKSATDGLYANADLAHRRLFSTIMDLNARLKEEFPDQGFAKPIDVPADPAAVHFE